MESRLRVLFSHSYFLNKDKKQWHSGNAYPPLGTIYAASFLRENGYEISLFDTMLANDESEIKSYLKEKPDFVIFYDDGFNYLSKMCLTEMRVAVFEMIKYCKSIDCKIIISSSDATDNYHLYLKNGADFVILGEGEQTLLDLIKSINQQLAIENIGGIAYLQSEKLNVNTKNPVLKDLDILPMPAWDLIDIEKYRSFWIERKGYFSLNIVTTRGCTYKCNWCAKPLFGARYHARSPRLIIEELEILVNQYKANHIWVCDDIFGLKPNWINEFNHLLHSKSWKPKYKIQSRADLLDKIETVELLAKSGCDEVWIGAESGSQKILDAMDKGITVAQIYESAQNLKNNNIKVALFIQLGYLGEEKSDILATIDMILAIMPYDIGISVSYPLPGTKFYEKVKNQLDEKRNWKDSDDLDTLFQSTYSRKFYKNLQKYIHALYRFKEQKFNNPFSFIILKKIIKIIYYRIMLRIYSFHHNQPF